jgi:hypothetical protein
LLPLEHEPAAGHVQVQLVSGGKTEFLPHLRWDD